MNETSNQTWRELRFFLGVAFLLSWGTGALYFLFRAWLNPLILPLGANNPVFLLMNCAPSLAALIAGARFGGWRGVRDVLSGLVRPFAPWWALIAFLVVPAVALTLVYLAPYWQTWPVAAHDVLVKLPLLMFTTRQIINNIAPFGEELGWRGYALPRLLENRNATVAALMLGAVWIVWHVPGFFISGLMAVGPEQLGWWSVGTLALSVIMTFLYVSANRNVIVGGIIPHFVINAAAAVGVWLSRPAEVLGLAVVAVGAALIMQARTRTFARIRS
ncbi:MAG: CPBP family intramembrane metalloprotease [Terricaulis sp.]